MDFHLFKELRDYIIHSLTTIKSSYVIELLISGQMELRLKLGR